MQIDSTYSNVRFSYVDASRQPKSVITLKEEEYPDYYHQPIAKDDNGEILDAAQPSLPPFPSKPLAPVEPALKETHLTFQKTRRVLPLMRC